MPQEIEHFDPDALIAGGERGLTSREAMRRLLQYGKNAVYAERKFRPIAALIQKFNSPLLLLLIGASAVSLFLGQRTNALIILVMVCVSAVLDFVNTFRSERAVQKLTNKVTTTATVVRDGVQKEVHLRSIVPGDVILLGAGDVVPADGEIIQSKDLFIDQSPLTGESFPVEKLAHAPPEAEQDALNAVNKVFLGTNVVIGYGVMRATKTGKATEFGKIADRLGSAPQETEFEKGTKQFSAFIMKVTFVLVLLTFFLNVFLKPDILNSFIFAVAIAIGLTPELLPVIMTVALSRGSIRMAKKDVVVKRLPAIQNFGGMNILCTDKTGTLTENKITLVRYVDGFGSVSERVLQYGYVGSIFHTGISGPLDAAIREHKGVDASQYRKIDEIPFDFERRRDSVVVAFGGKHIAITKGAPENILAIATRYEKQGAAHALTARMREKILGEFSALSGEGFRVIAVAFKEIAGARQTYDKAIEEKMTFAGFMAFLDPPKMSAAQAIADLERFGIEVKILTGDSDVLTKKVCGDIGIPVAGIMLGREVAACSEGELRHKAKTTSIFARISPEQKERIILALRREGSVVGYLGDGINDALALRAADVGISVSNAVDVAKETADIILLRKNLEVLKDGVIEGRRTFQNTLKYVTMGLSSNFGNMFSMTGISAVLPFLPMLPAQILLNNFLYDFSQLSLPADSVDDEDLRTPPRWDLGFIKRYMVVFGVASSLFDLITFGALFFVFNLRESAFQTGWFVESLATQVLVIYVIRTKKIPLLESRPTALLVLNTLCVVGAAWALPFLPFGKFFGFVPLPSTTLVTIFGIMCVYLVVVQITKTFFFRLYSPHERHFD